MLSRNSFAIGRLRQLPWGAIGRWWAVGISFYVGGLGVLYAFISLAGMPLLWGTLLAAEITTILRYAINDRWVFGERRPSWKRFLQYHVANAGGFVIWWISVNALPRLGMHYLVASTIGTGASVFFTMATNFLWVWAKAPKAANIG